MVLEHVLKSAAALLMLAGLGGCGGGGGSAAAPAAAAPPATQADMGEVAVTLTDAAGDFIAYIVDVDAIRLQRADGDRVDTLPLRTRVDFTQLSEVSEFLSVATVPAGTYDEVVLTLDFTDAEVLVQDGDGAPVAARVVDADGNSLAMVDVALTLDGDDRVRVTPATVRAFSLDFDLDASNTIDFGTSPPTVTVEPVLLAAAQLEEQREHRLRGLLVRADGDAGEVTVKVRPFRHRAGGFGRYRFSVDQQTSYEIDGTAYQGSAGITALAGQPEDTPLVALGSVVAGELTATRVVAGSSVYWSDAEMVHGVVTGRSADTLTVSGAAVAFADGRYQFRRAIAVVLGEATSFSAPGLDADALDALSVSVGQRIVATGEFTSDDTLDASGGQVRMLLSALWGDVVTADPLVVDLHLLAGRRPAAFDFTGTGVTAGEDADPGAYAIDTGALGLLDLQVDDLVQVRGLVARFGVAPPDFQARTVVDVAAATRGATARVRWPDGSAVPFSAMSPDRLDLALADARAVVLLNGGYRDLPLAPDRLALTAPGERRGIYAVAERGAGTVSLYRRFDDAVDALAMALDAGARLHRVTAHGRYTEDNDELITVRASFVFQTGDTDGGVGG